MEQLVKNTGNLCMMDIFTYQDLRIQISTYNVAEQKPEDAKLNLLVGLPEIPEQATNPPDFIIVGLQELKSNVNDFVFNAMFNEPWTNALRDSLSPFGYLRVKAFRVRSMGLTLYCLRKHLHHLRGIECSYTRTGAMGLLGNKGGIALRLKIYGAKICFISCHLAPHDNNLSDRIEDYHSIVDSVRFNSKRSSTIFHHDYIFWFGDLNFRLCESNALTAEEIESEVKKRNIHRLLTTDQLKAVQESGEAFSELIEPQINFLPTFKFLMNTKEYNLTRRPAWCDRILYKVNNNTVKKKNFSVKVENYEAIDSITVSDHRPVTALFSIKVFCDFKDKSVEFLHIDTWYKSRDNIATISFNSHFTPSENDYISIFYNNFSCINEHCVCKNIKDLLAIGKENDECIESIQPGDQVNVTFSKDDIVNMNPAHYELVYLTAEGDIMGISHLFELRSHEEFLRRGSYRPLDSEDAK